MWNVGGMEEVEAWALSLSWPCGREAALRQPCLSLKFLAHPLTKGPSPASKLRRGPHCKLEIACLKLIHQVLAALSHTCLSIHCRHWPGQLQRSLWSSEPVEAARYGRR